MVAVGIKRPKINSINTRIANQGRQSLLAKRQSFLDGGYAIVSYCRSLHFIYMHYGISSGINAQYVETTLDTHVHLLDRVIVRSDVYMLTLAMIRLIFSVVKF